MDPERPVLPGHDAPETLFGESQPEYATLPAIHYSTDVNGEQMPAMLSRWRFSDDERERIARGEDLFLEVLGRNHPPVKLFVAESDEVFREIMRHEIDDRFDGAFRHTETLYPEVPRASGHAPGCGLWNGWECNCGGRKV